MGKGIRRGLLIGLVVYVLVALYVWMRHHGIATTELLDRISTAAFQWGLVLLMIGVIIFSRLFSYRRRMKLANYSALLRANTRDEAKQMVEEDEQKNEDDEYNLKERGRDITFLVAALFVILVSILLTFNQIKW